MHSEDALAGRGASSRPIAGKVYARPHHSRKTKKLSRAAGSREQKGRNGEKGRKIGSGSARESLWRSPHRRQRDARKEPFRPSRVETLLPPTRARARVRSRARAQVGALTGTTGAHIASDALYLFTSSSYSFPFLLLLFLSCFVALLHLGGA